MIFHAAPLILNPRRRPRQKRGVTVAFMTLQAGAPR
jgi:hypothetical protein